MHQVQGQLPKLPFYPNISVDTPRNFYFPQTQVQSVSLVPKEKNCRSSQIDPFTCPLCKENFVHHQILNEHLRKVHAVLI